MVLKVFQKVSELAHISYFLRTQQILPRLSLLWGLVLVFLIGLFTFTPKPAAAILRQHQDAPGVMRYHSQQSLPDESGNAWQVILFKEIIPSQPTRFNLRLVGFPGITEVSHPQLLELITAKGKVLTAPDVFPQAAPAPNVGQYDFTDVLHRLQADESLTVSIPVKGEKTLTLEIPQSLVTEWQWLATEIK
jgi:hypothetical protein